MIYANRVRASAQGGDAEARSIDKRKQREQADLRLSPGRLLPQRGRLFLIFLTVFS
jgi:hypothetical protein